jgi:hypothetical protein
MENKATNKFPTWAFIILAAGGFWASGLYLGILINSGDSDGSLVKVILFGLFGFLMGLGAVLSYGTRQ